MPTSLNIAIIEDNDDLRELLIQNLSALGYFIKGADSAEELDDLFVNNDFDVLIADINLPGEDGLSVVERYKKFNKRLQVVILSARVSVDDKVVGYQAGADLYLTKPISNEELHAALGSIARRIYDHKEDSGIILNIQNLTITASKIIRISKQDAFAVKAFCESSSSYLPYFKLLEIYGDSFSDNSKRALEVRIARLRKKFNDAGVQGKIFQASRGEGYQLLMSVHLT